MFCVFGTIFSSELGRVGGRPSLKIIFELLVLYSHYKVMQVLNKVV